MKLAAIDIGSNAIRLQIVKVFEEENLVSFKKLEFLRFPLRLGHDVFKAGAISRPTADKFVKLMKTFQLLVELYEVDGYSAVATSAMREAANGTEIQQYVKNRVGLDIDIISGTKEAHILNKAITPYLKEGQHYIHIDVGGGSTELNLFHGRTLTNSESFRIGSVRQLSPSERAKTFQQMKEWTKEMKITKAQSIEGIGTGGNINKLFKLANHSKNQTISLAELKALRAYVKEFSYEQRMEILKMNPDRADVIVPGSEIYIRVLQDIGCDHLLVPKVGLKDGLIYHLYGKMFPASISRAAFIGGF